MFFRPDLLFGDGRTLVGGTLMLVLGMRYLFAPHPPGVLWALPAWNWNSLAFGIAAGIIPIVLMRGMMKLVQRFMRLRDGVFSGYPSLAAREWMLLLFGADFGFAFHHVFAGRTVFSTIGQPGWFPITSRFWIGIGLMGAAAWWLLVVKGGIKKLIGEPFCFETFMQTLQQQLIFTAGWGVFFYGFMSMLNSKGFGSTQPWDDQSAVGLGLFVMGILVLTLGRAIVQHYQREGMLEHFVAAIIPAQPDRARERMMLRILEGISRLSPRRQEAAWLTIHRAWQGIEDDERSLMVWTAINALAQVELDEGAWASLVSAQRRALGRLDDAARNRALMEIARSVASFSANKAEAASRAEALLGD
jgi:hypothetical protein